MASLKLNGVNKVYPSGALALYNVNLELSDKEFVAVVGAEKSGKSTLLRVIAGLEDVTSGEISIGGKDVTDADTKERDVAVVFRNDTLNASLTVYDNMAYGLKMRKAPEVLIDGRVKAAAAVLDLTDVLNRKPKQLTSEQKQKAAMGRAIVREPKLYLLDDPVAGLDSDLKAQMRNVILNLQTRMQGTFVYATKNVNEALTMATRIVVLREGIVQQVDTPGNLYDYPANAYVAFYIGSPTINFINGATLQREGDDVVACFNGGSLVLPRAITERFTDIGLYLGTGKRVILGIRPEDMRTVKGEGLFKATVSDVESIAGKAYADCDVSEGLSFVVSAEGRKKGDAVNISADLSHIYIFDDATRLTLLRRDGGYTATGCADAEVLPLPYGEEEQIKKKSKPAPATKRK